MPSGAVAATAVFPVLSVAASTPPGMDARRNGPRDAERSEAPKKRGPARR